MRWFIEARKLSREQLRILEAAARHNEPVAVSAMSLLEIAILVSGGLLNLKLEDIFEPLEANPLFQILPLTTEIASEIASLGRHLQDPADRAIARVHRLRLVTSDQRIIESKLVAVVE